MSDHYNDGPRKHDEHGTIFACGCGENFAGINELNQHLEEKEEEGAGK